MAEWALPESDALRLTQVLGACIASVDPTLPGADAYAAERFGFTDASQVLVIFVDGLGYLPLHRRIGHAPVLRAHREDMHCAYTVVPSTTAAGITAFGTGCMPGQTRMVGYSVAQGDGVMNLLAFEEGVDPAQWQPCETHFEALARAGVEVAVISPPQFAHSGLTRAALRGSRHVGAVSWEQRCEAAIRELRAGTPLVYLYWSELDHQGHIHGVESSEWTGALEEFDAGLRHLLARLPRGVMTALTADHGMIDVSPSTLLDCAFHPELSEGVRIIAGETRSVHVHAEPGQGEAVRQRWAQYLGDRAWVMSPQEARHYLGDGPGIDLVGDAVVFMAQRHGIVDSRIQTPGAIGLIGVHGSLTEDEMLIPVMRLS